MKTNANYVPGNFNLFKKKIYIFLFYFIGPGTYSYDKKQIKIPPSWK